MTNIEAHALGALLAASVAWAAFACGAKRQGLPTPEPVRPPAPSSPTAPPDVPTPTFGAVLVIYRTADGAERFINCGGEVSLSGERELLHLDRKATTNE